MYTLKQDQKFERYRILHFLGESASGTSYIAQDEKQQHAVVLKLINPWSQLSEPSRRQFFRNMQIISQLSHPGLVPILNYGENRGQLFVARPFISLQTSPDDQQKAHLLLPMQATKAFSYAYQVAHILTYIHTHQVTHGSLTCSNILIKPAIPENPSASVLVTDTGLSAFVYRYGQSPEIYQPATLAPEQLRQQGQYASDQYALASILYFWLSGRFPFTETGLEAQKKKQIEDYPPLRTLNAQITGVQEKLIQKALRTSTRDRYSSMKSFEQALKRAQDASSDQDDTDAPAELVEVEQESMISTTSETGQPEKEQMAYLLITSPDTGEKSFTYQISQPETTIGHAGDSDILLDNDTLISRHHAQIQRQGQRYLIYDLRSTHGVKINAQKIKEGEGYLLNSGDRIYIGSYVITFYSSQDDRR